MKLARDLRLARPQLIIGLYCALALLTPADANSGWGKIADDRLSMIEDVETLFTGWGLEQGMHMTHNGGTLSWFTLSAPKEKSYSIAELTAQVRKNFMFDGSPWKAIPGEEIPYTMEIKDAEPLLCYVWP